MEKQVAKVKVGSAVMAGGFGTGRLIRMFAFAAAVASACAGLAAAQEDGVDPELEEFIRERPRKMQDVTPEEPPAVDAPADAKPPEFVPKNEITIIPQKPETPTAAKEKAGAKKKLPNAVGGRVAPFGIGNIINGGSSIKIGLSETTRIDAGVDFGVGSEKDWTTLTFETVWFYEWRFDISGDGVFGWYFGPGAAFGHYSATGPTMVDSVLTRLPPDTTIIYKEQKRKQVNAGIGVGVGGQIGLDVNLSFIDPDHSLYSMRNTSLSVDLRPMFYIAPENYPAFVLTLGLAFRFAF